MGLSKMAQLNTNSWIYSQDPLVKSYRDNNAKEASKGKLTLYATIHAVKSVAYSALGAFGLIIYLASAGRIQNRPWQYARLHGEMTAASVRAIFHFKPVMEELRVAEAKAFLHAILGHESLSIVTVIKAPRTEALLQKLKGLTATQLEEVLKGINRGNLSLESAFLEKLHSLRQETSDSAKAAIIDKQIRSIQTNLHREFGFIACHYKGQEGIRIAMLREKRKEALEQVFPDLKPRLDRLEAVQGIEVTQDQYNFCIGLGPVNRNYTDNDPALPSPAILEEMVKIGRKNNWKDVIAHAQSACRAYGSVMDKRKFSAEGYAHLFRAANVLPVGHDIHIMRKCLIYRNQNIAKTPQEMQQLAQLSFEMLRTRRSHVAIETLEYCLGYLLDDASMQWMPAQEKDNEPVRFAMDQIRLVAPQADWTAKMIEKSFAAGKLTLVKYLALEGRSLARPQDEERVIRAWQQCPNQNVRLQAMPALQDIGYQFLSGQKWPRLNALLCQYASIPANVAAAPEACEHVLHMMIVDNDQRHIVLQRLALANQHGLQKLRDNCIDIILTNSQESSAWLEEQPDLIAAGLRNTLREVGCCNDLNMNLWRAKEGLALLRYAQAHPGTDLSQAVREYLLRNPNKEHFRMAVQRLPPQDRANFRILEEFCR